MEPESPLQLELSRSYPILRKAMPRLLLRLLVRICSCMPLLAQACSTGANGLFGLVLLWPMRGGNSAALLAGLAVVATRPGVRPTVGTVWLAWSRTVQVRLLLRLLVRTLCPLLGLIPPGLHMCRVSGLPWQPIMNTFGLLIETVRGYGWAG